MGSIQEQLNIATDSKANLKDKLNSYLPRGYKFDSYPTWVDEIAAHEYNRGRGSAGPGTTKYYIGTLSDGHGTVTGAGEYEQGQTVNVEATPIQNYVFDYWSSACGKSYPQTNPLEIQNISFADIITAHFTAGTPPTPTTYTLTFKFYNDTQDVEQYTVNAGNSFIIPTFTKTPPSNCTGGIYCFQDVNGVKYHYGDTIIPTGNMVFKAIWMVNVSYNSNISSSAVKLIMNGALLTDPYTKNISQLDQIGYINGGSCIVPTAYCPGYDFRGWSSDPTTYTPVNLHDSADHDTTLYAFWDAVSVTNQAKYLVTRYANDGEFTDDPKTVRYDVINRGETLNNCIGTIKSTSPSGPSFDGWYNAPDNGVPVSDTDPIYADLTVYAYCVIQLSLNLDGGTLNPINPVWVRVNKPIGNVLPTPTKEHCVFLGWYKNGDTTKTHITSTDSFSAPVTLVADWEQLYYLNVIREVSSSGTVSGGGWYAVGTEVTISATPAQGRIFRYWKNRGQQITGATINVIVTNDSQSNIYMAVFSSILNVSTSVNPVGSGTVTMNHADGVYYWGDTLTLVAQPSTGYRFDHWEWSNTVTSAIPTGTEINNPTLSKVLGSGWNDTPNATYTAVFVLDVPQYTVGANTNPSTGAGYVTGEGLYNENSTCNALEAHPYNGWLFDHWSDGDTNNPHTPFTVTQNVALTAYFVGNPVYHIYFGVATGCENMGAVEVEMNGTTYTQSPVNPFSTTPYTIRAIANSGYHFVQWNDGDTNATRSFTGSTADVTYTATFAQDAAVAQYWTGSTNLNPLDYNSLSESSFSNIINKGANWIQKYVYIAVDSTSTVTMSYTNTSGMTINCRLSDVTSSFANVPSGWKVLRFKSAASSISSTNTTINIS